jgi:hypothetical protein
MPHFAYNAEHRRAYLEFLKEVKWVDSKKLKFLDRMIASHLQETHDLVQERKLFLKSLRLVDDGGLAEVCRRMTWVWNPEEERRDYKEVEGNFIAVVWSGMDCDCVRYSGEVHYILAYKAEVEKHIESQYRDAEGPISFYLMRPSEADKIHYSSRDLALEAFEDGHSHVVSDARFDEDGDFQEPHVPNEEGNPHNPDISWLS